MDAMCFDIVLLKNAKRPLMFGLLQELQDAKDKSKGCLLSV